MTSETDPDKPDKPDDGSELTLNEISSDGGQDGSQTDPEHRRRHRRELKRPVWQRALLILLISGLVLGACGIGLVWFLTDRYLGNVDRVENVFEGLDESQRPAPATIPAQASDPPVTFVLVGSDSRNGAALSDRSDVIMLMRITSDRTQTQFISIPRDSWVMIPGYGMNKINAAYAFGGPSLLIQSLELLTGIRIDHFAAVDFTGFAELTDALGGVDVLVRDATTNNGYTFTQGVNHLDGAAALAYVRQRYGLPGGDLDRVERQQSYMRAVIGKVLVENMLSDVGRTDDLLLALTSAIAVDDTLSNTDLLGFAYSLRGLTAAGLAFFTVPVSGTGREGAASVVYIEPAGAARMWTYLGEDSLAEHATEFAQLPATPR